MVLSGNEGALLGVGSMLYRDLGDGYTVNIYIYKISLRFTLCNKDCIQSL